MLNKFAGRNHEDITQEELDELTDEEYRVYHEWRVQVNLDYMVAEGFVEKFNDPITGEVLYKLAEETQ